MAICGLLLGLSGEGNGIGLVCCRLDDLLFFW
jgi:hypothetical protein